jgi:hypothetical protein
LSLFALYVRRTDENPAPKEDTMKYLLQIYSDGARAEFEWLSAEEREAIVAAPRGMKRF